MRKNIDIRILEEALSLRDKEGLPKLQQFIKVKTNDFDYIKSKAFYSVKDKNERRYLQCSKLIRD